MSSCSNEGDKDRTPTRRQPAAAEEEGSPPPPQLPSPTSTPPFNARLLPVSAALDQNLKKAKGKKRKSKNKWKSRWNRGRGRRGGEELEDDDFEDDEERAAAAGSGPTSPLSSTGSCTSSSSSLHSNKNRSLPILDIFSRFRANLQRRGSASPRLPCRGVTRKGPRPYGDDYDDDDEEEEDDESPRSPLIPRRKQHRPKDNNEDDVCSKCSTKSTKSSREHLSLATFDNTASAAGVGGGGGGGHTRGQTHESIVGEVVEPPAGIDSPTAARVLERIEDEDEDEEEAAAVAAEADDIYPDVDVIASAPPYGKARHLPGARPRAHPPSVATISGAVTNEIGGKSVSKATTNNNNNIKEGRTTSGRRNCLLNSQINSSSGSNRGAEDFYGDPGGDDFGSAEFGEGPRRRKK